MSRKKDNSKIHISVLFRNRLVKSFLFGYAILIFCLLSFSIFNAFFDIYGEMKVSLHDNVLGIDVDINDSCIDTANDLSKLVSEYFKVTEKGGSSELIDEDDTLDEILKEFGSSQMIKEVNYINNDNIVVASTLPENIGYDMKSQEQSAAFAYLVYPEATIFTQDFRPSGIDETVWKKYVGAPVAGPGYVQIGFDTEEYRREILLQILHSTEYMHIRKTGYYLILDEDRNVLSTGLGKENGDIKFSEQDYKKLFGQDDGSALIIALNSKNEMLMVLGEKSGDFLMIGCMPVDEIIHEAMVDFNAMVVLSLILFMFLYWVVFRMVKKRVVRNIENVSVSVNTIAGGNFETKLDIADSLEFFNLSKDINSMSEAIKRYIEEEKNRNAEDIRTAKVIQESTLPSVFPPYPGRTEFDIYATMKAAKEVGGDFFDLYLLDSNRLVITIADVSGKGIPAAMFMMQTKALLQHYIKSGLSLDEAVEQVNNQLNENNAASMFVTVWTGVIDLTTGVVEYINAGHNYPFFGKAGEKYEMIENTSGLVLGCVPNLKYEKLTFKMEKGDVVYLYTDGVTESLSRNDEFYGDLRLRSCLNRTESKVSMSELCALVSKDLDVFVDEAPQFDDITMLALKFNG